MFGGPICTLLLMCRNGVSGSQKMNKFSFILPNDFTERSIYNLPSTEKILLNTWYWLSFILAIGIFKESLVCAWYLCVFLLLASKENLWEVLVYIVNQALASSVLYRIAEGTPAHFGGSQKSLHRWWESLKQFLGVRKESLYSNDIEDCCSQFQIANCLIEWYSMRWLVWS